MSAVYMGQLEALLTLLEEIPDELITLDGHTYTALIANITTIRSTLKRWEAGHKVDLPLLPGLSTLNPVVVIHYALADCPDQFPSPGTTELIFIQDQQLRENLRLDMSGMNKALSSGEWKAATVLAGSIVEAVLLCALQQQDSARLTSAIANASGRALRRNPAADLERWNLHEFIEVAAEGGIKADTASQARLAKDFRNLLHPGRASRVGQICDRGTALAAVAAVELVVRDLTPEFTAAITCDPKD
jgi:hypothetical protein